MPQKKQGEEEQELSGLRKGAILLMAIGTDASAKIFKHLRDEEIEAITKEIALLKNVPANQISKVIQEFYQLLQAQEYIAAGGLDYAEEVLRRAVGPEKANEIVKKIQRSLEVRGFNVLKKIDPQQLMTFIQKEHPQTVALVLSQIEPEQAAQILDGLPEEMQKEVMYRFATMETVSRETINEIEKILESRIDFKQTTNTRFGGVKATAEILNVASRATEKAVIEEIAVRNPELADEIKNLMFVFEDILQLDDTAIRKIMKEVDTKTLALALKGASDDLKDKFYNNMTQRAREMLQEEMEYLGPVRLSEVESAQQQIVEVVRMLDERNEIQIRASGKEDVIIE